MSDALRLHNHLNPPSFQTAKKLVILDRDGVINHDSTAYIKSPDEFIPIPGSLEAIANFKSAGWTVAIATNQSGIGRGIFSLNTLNLIHRKLHYELSKLSSSVDYIAYCPHHPDDNCCCRKPRTGLLIEISKYFSYPLPNTVVIGDSLRDLLAAATVGAHPTLVLTGNGGQTLCSAALPAYTSVYQDLQTASIHILSLYT